MSQVNPAHESKGRFGNDRALWLKYDDFAELFNIFCDIAKTL